MTTSPNDSSGGDAATESATESTPASGGDDSAEVSAAGGTASGSEGVGQAGYIDDSQLPEDLRPDADGLTGADNAGATEPATRTPGDEPGVAEPTA